MVSTQESGAGVEGVGAAGAVGAGSRVLSRPRPVPRPRVELCPYCGRESMNTTRCEGCGGKFDALSRQATQNAMGPWWVRDEQRAFRPGCSYETIRLMVSQGKIGRETVVRGPTTRQFWRRAGRTPGVAHLLGACHACGREVSAEAFMCAACGASFTTETDRQHLGLASVSLLPGQASPERIAAVSVPTGSVRAEAGLGALGVGAGGEGEGAGWGGAGVVEGPRGAGGLGRGSLLSGDPMLEQLEAVRALGAERGTGGVGERGGVLHGVAGGDGHGQVGGHHHRHRHRHGPSPVAAVAFFVLGVVLTACGVGAALITAQGGVEDALAALGLGRRSAGVAVARGMGEEGRGLVGGSTIAGSGGEEVGAGEGDGAGVGVVGVERVTEAPVASGTGVPADTAHVEDGRVRALRSVVDLLGTGDAADLREGLRLLERAARGGAIGGEEASAWRAALEARLARGGLGTLP